MENLYDRIMPEKSVINDNLEVKKERFYNTRVIKGYGIFMTLYILISLILLIVVKVELGSFSQRLSEKTIECDSLKLVIDNLEKEEHLINFHYLAGKYTCTNSTILPNRDTVMKLIKECDAWYPDIILAQFMLESGSGTSNLARSANNLYGMKVGSKESDELSIGEYCGYRVYKNWQISVIDRVKLDYRYFNLKPTRDEYLKKLSERYSEDENYLSKINNIINNMKK